MVRLTWLDCAAADAHPPVGESEVDLVLDVPRGSPLFPPFLSILVPQRAIMQVLAGDE